VAALATVVETGGGDDGPAQGTAAPVDRGVQPFGEARPRELRAEPPRHGVVRRRLIQLSAAEAAERQPVAERRLGRRVAGPVPGPPLAPRQFLDPPGERLLVDRLVRPQHRHRPQATRLVERPEMVVGRIGRAAQRLGGHGGNLAGRRVSVRWPFAGIVSTASIALRARRARLSRRRSGRVAL
jgi:hypothetical protein